MREGGAASCSSGRRLRCGWTLRPGHVATLRWSVPRRFSTLRNQENPPGLGAHGRCELVYGQSASDMHLTGAACVSSAHLGAEDHLAEQEETLTFALGLPDPCIGVVRSASDGTERDAIRLLRGAADRGLQRSRVGQRPQPLQAGWVPALVAGTPTVQFPLGLARAPACRTGVGRWWLPRSQEMSK